MKKDFLSVLMHTNRGLEPGEVELFLSLEVNKSVIGAKKAEKPVKLRVVYEALIMDN
ncbi:MAG: hypothetical protein ACYST2_02985 [Planctomycetota bacterium]|jgi:hypothetical protein